MSTCLGKELFIRFTMCVFREPLSVNVCSSFPFGFEGGIWDLIVLISDHCLSFCLVVVCPSVFTGPLFQTSLKTLGGFRNHIAV